MDEMGSSSRQLTDGFSGALKQASGATIWGGLRRRIDSTLIRMLAISLCAHLALVLVIQPRPFRAADEVTVISARLEPPVHDASLAAPVEESSIIEPAKVDPAQTERKISEQLVTQAPPTQALPPPASVAESPPVPPAVQNSLPVEQVDRSEKPAPVAVAEAPQASPANQGTPSAAALPSIPVMIDTHWYEARQLDVSPKASRPIKPAYPQEAIKRGLQGTVKLRLRVDEFGVVHEVEVVDADPAGVFDQSAIEAFKSAKFEAARKDRKPVRSIIHIRVNYELDD